MIIEPEFPVFAELYRAGHPQVAWTTLVADLETPISALLKLAGDDANTFLLESVEGGAVRGRYSFIGTKPDVVWQCHSDRVEINRDALARADAFAPIEGGAIDAAFSSADRETLTGTNPGSTRPSICHRWRPGSTGT